MTQYLETNFDFNSDQLVELFDELPFWSAPFGLKLLENIKYRKGINALDIGFGAGFPLTEIAMRLGESCKVYGIDPWEAAIKRTEKKIQFYGIKNVEIIKGAAENIPLKNKSIDLITSNNGLNNVQDLDKSLGECSRIMKQGGQFVQTMNLNNTMIEFYSVMEKAAKALKLDNCPDLMEKHIYEKRKPLDEYKRLIEKHGFKVQSILNDKFEYKYVDGTTMLNHYFIRLAFLDSWREIIPKDKQTKFFETIEKLINQQAERDGFFILKIPFALIDCEKI